MIFHNITILYYLLYYSSWAKKLEKFTNTVNPNSQLCHSRHLLVHLQIPKHHLISNEQQLLSLMLETKIKTILFCIPKIPSRMMQSITYNDDVQSCETSRKQDYSIPTTSTPNHHTQRFDTTSASILNLHTPTILPPVGK